MAAFQQPVAQCTAFARLLISTSRNAHIVGLRLTLQLTVDVVDLRSPASGQIQRGACGGRSGLPAVTAGEEALFRDAAAAAGVQEASLWQSWVLL